MVNIAQRSKPERNKRVNEETIFWKLSTVNNTHDNITEKNRLSVADEVWEKSISEDCILQANILSNWAKVKEKQHKKWKPIFIKWIASENNIDTWGHGTRRLKDWM